MRRVIFFMLAGLLIASSCLPARAEPFYKQVAKVMSDLCARVPVASDEKTRVYIQPPRHLPVGTSEEPGLLTGGGFIRHFQAACAAALQPPFGEIPRDELDQVWSEVKIAQMTEASDPDKTLQWAEDIKKQILLPLDGIIMSECSILTGDSGPMVVLVNLYFLDIYNVSKYTAAGELYLTSEQASNATEKPQNYQKISEQTRQLENVVSHRVEQEKMPEESLFDLFVNVDKGTGGVYEEGEKMTIYVSAETDCYIAVINVNVDGDFTLLFPNSFEQDNFIRAGQSCQIPGNESREYDLAIYPPFGIETIKVIASSTPFQVNSLIENSKSPFPGLAKGLSKGISSMNQLMDSLMGNTAGILSRDTGTAKDVGIAPRRRQFAEAMCLFTTIPSGSKGLWIE